jgi:hypothetical protein
MSEQPSGLLAWGQGGIYDAIDDRQVIAAVTRSRVGLAWPIVARAGAGLDVIITGGWFGVTDCGDRTSAVVGSRTDQTVSANPGAATTTREDVIWVEPQPDQGTWTMRVIPAADLAGQAGLIIGRIIVPPNATLSSQMDIRPVTAALERRLMMQWRNTPVNELRNEQTWDQAWVYTWVTGAFTLEPGQWYRARFTANSPMMVSGQTLNGRIGIGSRTEGQNAQAAILGRAAVIAYRQLGAATHAEVEWVFQHPPNAAHVSRNFDGRIWAAGTGSYYHCSVNQGDGLQITVEDIGS